MNNNDLLKNIGNFVNRVIKFCHAKMDGVVPQYTVSEEHQANVNPLLTTYNNHLEALKLRLGLASLLQISAVGNKFLQDNKLDNKLFVDNPEICGNVVGTALNHILLLANLLHPFMPKTTDAIFAQLGLEPAVKIPDVWDAHVMQKGHKLGTPQPLFTTIPVTKVEEWQEAFSGDAAKEMKRLEAEKAAAKKAAKKQKKDKKKEALVPPDASKLQI